MNNTDKFNLKALAVSVMLAFGSSAWALPTGGAVSAGGASIATNAGTTTVGQTTQNVAINWQSFSIGAGEAVRFVQPSSSSVALNRVLGGDPSSILGSLSANGKVFLVNPNGILFGQGAQVNVGGLVASTLNITDADFMANTYKFSGTSAASVLNQGSINADGGYVALLGANVSNEGVISARLGTVALASGNAMTLDMAGDGLLSVAINQAAANALVQNSGTIRADGGQVLLTAQAAGNLLQGVVNNTGVIQAQTIDTHSGTIRLLAGMQGGTVNAGGTLDASAPNGGNGGFIEASAAHVNIADNVQITTFAPAGATGTFLIDPQDFNVGGVGSNIAGTTLAALLVTNSVVITTVPGPDTVVAGAPPVSTLHDNGAVAAGDININDSIGTGAPLWTATPNTTTLTLNAFRDVNINGSITATNGNVVVCCGRDVNVRGTITTTGGSVSLSGGHDITLFGTGAMTTTNGNITMCAGHDINIIGKIALTDSGIGTQSLGLFSGLALSAGNAATGPGLAGGGGTVLLPGGALRPSVTKAGAPATDVQITYNAASYAAPTDYSASLILTGAVLTQRMLVFPGGADKTFDGTTAAVFTSLQGLPAGVSLVAGPGSSATFDTALAGINKPITFSGFTLAGANVANFALPVPCCGPLVTRTTGTIRPAVVVVPPDVVVPPAAVPPELLPLLLPVIQNEIDSEVARGLPGLSLGVIDQGVRMPPVLVAVVPPPPPPVVVVPETPVVAPPPVPPQIYVPPVRLRKRDRN